jgi:hypothetical protein
MENRARSLNSPFPRDRHTLVGGALLVVSLAHFSGVHAQSTGQVTVVDPAPPGSIRFDPPIAFTRAPGVLEWLSPSSVAVINLDRDGLGDEFADVLVGTANGVWVVENLLRAEDRFGLVAPVINASTIPEPPAQVFGTSLVVRDFSLGPEVAYLRHGSDNLSLYLLEPDLAGSNDPTIPVFRADTEETLGPPILSDVIDMAGAPHPLAPNGVLGLVGLGGSIVTFARLPEEVQEIEFELGAAEAIARVTTPDGASHFVVVGDEMCGVLARIVSPRLAGCRHRAATVGSMA